MNIKFGVFYKRYGDKVYVRDTRGQREFMLNETAGDILDCIKAVPDCEITDILEHIRGIYGEEAAAEDICEFVESLADEGLISLGDRGIEDGAPDGITGEVISFCMKEGLIQSAIFELTYRCNEKCVHCYIDDDVSCMAEKELKTEEYFRIIDELCDMGCGNILLTGGEVCLREDFVKIAEYAAEKGILVDIYTNGIAMTDEQFDELCRIPLNSVSFSLYGSDAEIHDRITGVKGSFEKTLKRMMMFKCAGVATFFKSVLMDINKDDSEEMMKLSKRLGIEITTASAVAPSHCGNDPCALRIKDTRGYIDAFDTFEKYYPADRRNIPVRDMDGPVCMCGHTALSINPYGEIYPCVAMTVSLGNVRTDSLAEVWEHSEKLEEIRRIKFRDMECGSESCKYRDFCAVCMGSAYDKKSGKVIPDKEFCRIAEAQFLIAEQNR